MRWTKNQATTYRQSLALASLDSPCTGVLFNVDGWQVVALPKYLIYVPAGQEFYFQSKLRKKQTGYLNTACSTALLSPSNLHLASFFGFSFSGVGSRLRWIRDLRGPEQLCSSKPMAEAGEGAAKGVEARTLWALNRLMVLLGVRAEKADKFVSGFTTEETSARMSCMLLCPYQ